MADSFISNSSIDWSENESDQENSFLDYLNESAENQTIESNVMNNDSTPSLAAPNDNDESNTNPFKNHAIPAKQPAEQFADSLVMEFCGHTKLSVNDLPILRNNIVTASKLWDLLFIADRSQILVHEYNPITRRPEPRPSLVIETRPSHTTIGMRAGANWTTDPHGINFLKISNLSGREVLTSAGDDGRIQMWYTVNIQKAVRKKSKMLRYRLNGGISSTSSSMSLASSVGLIPPTVLGPANIPDQFPADDDVEIKPVLVLQGHKSSWGISIHDSKRLLAVSENSCTVNIYCLGPFLDGLIPVDEIEVITSPALDHNIPDVDFIEVENPEEGILYVACVSISGQATMWSFYYGEEGRKRRETNDYQTGEVAVDTESARPLDPSTSLEIVRTVPHSSGTEDDNFNNSPIDSDDESDMSIPNKTNSRRASHCMEPFENGVWWFEENLKQEGWSISSLYEDDFKAVSSLYEVTGNKWLAEEPLFKFIMKMNRKTLMNNEHSDDKFTAISNQDLLDYPAIRFMTNDIETKFIQKLSNASWSSISQEPHYNLPLCMNKEEKMSAYLALHGKSNAYLRNPPFKNKFFLITTKKSLYLCQAEDLFCNAARSNVFSWESPYGSDEIYFDRLNIVEVIKPLSAVVIVSQIGAISIFRLTQYRGIFGMRQEYAFPDVEKLLFEGTRLRVLVGVAASPIKTGGDKSLQPKFRLDIVYLDGLVLTFELSRKGVNSDELFIENIVL